MTPPAVNVEGYLDSYTGQGEAARLYLAALEAAEVPVTASSIALEDVAGGPAADLPRRPWTAPWSTGVEPSINLICVNGLELSRLAATKGPDYFSGRRSIGVWAWETDTVPARMTESAGLLDEVWGYSEWVAANLRPALSIPVVAVPLAIVPPRGGPGRPVPDLPQGFRFMFVFDFLSTLQRKNPLGLVEAFSRAFSPGEGPQLVLKTINGDFQPRAVERLREAIARRPDVHVVDGAMDEGEKAAFFEACDCYVSLHRSEGFGLPIGEAMALGKPAIATGYSGNLEFMNPDNSFFVGHELVEVGPGNHLYPAEGRWAEPDLDHAAELMRRLAQDPAGARDVGARGRDDVLSRFSPRAVGATVRSRIEALAASPR